MFEKKAKKFEMLAEIEKSLIAKKNQAIETIKELGEKEERGYWEESELSTAAVTELMDELLKQFK